MLSKAYALHFYEPERLRPERTTWSWTCIAREWGFIVLKNKKAKYTENYYDLILIKLKW